MLRLAKPVNLPPADAAKLQAIVTKGTHKSRKIARARALLAMSRGKGAAAVQAEVGISPPSTTASRAATWPGGWPRRWKSARAAGSRRR